ncbi:MAG: hypothetical protein CL565_01600 [Alphaproteobacteria bacterium]|nr:hypothetical protein [Alphaproteobacteria bacterium]
MNKTTLTAIAAAVIVAIAAVGFLSSDNTGTTMNDVTPAAGEMGTQLDTTTQGMTETYDNTVTTINAEESMDEAAENTEEAMDEMSETEAAQEADEAVDEAEEAMDEAAENAQDVAEDEDNAFDDAADNMEKAAEDMGIGETEPEDHM